MFGKIGRSFQRAINIRLFVLILFGKSRFDPRVDSLDAVNPSFTKTHEIKLE